MPYYPPPRVGLTNPIELSSSYESIQIMNGTDSELKTYLRRAIRVPDDKKEYDLPPDCRPFPIYEIARSRSILEVLT